MITNLISPSGEPSIQDNLWHIATSDNSGSTDMKYVFDVYKGEEQLVRVKVFPDPTNGKGYFDASPIVKNEISFGWFVPDASGLVVATPSQSGEVALTYSIRVGEDVSAVTTTNLASGDVKAYNFTPTLFKRKQFDFTQFNNKWLTNRPKYAKLTLTERLMLGIKTTSQKQLTVKTYDCAGNLLKSNLTNLSQSPVFFGLTVAPNGDIYACAPNSAIYNNSIGQIYKSTNGGVSFSSLGQASRFWDGIAAAPNGDIFATEQGGTIYKQTGGVGNFVSLGITNRLYSQIAVAPNGDIYVTVRNGDIWKSTNGGTAFTNLGLIPRVYIGITVTPNGDIYTSANGGYIYKSTNGGTTFTQLNSGIKNWNNLASDIYGNIYAAESNGNIYKSSDNGATFTSLGLTTRNYYGLASDSTGNIYTSVLATTNNFFKINNIYSNTIQQLDISPSAINSEISNFIDSSTCYYTVEFDNQLFRVDIDCSPIYTPINLHFMNALGVFDTARFKLASKLTMDIERKAFEKADYRFGSSAVTYYDNNNVYHETKINYGSKAMWSYNLTMDYPTDAEYQWLAELIMSPLIYMELDGNYYPVTIKDTNYEYSTYNTNKLRVLNVNIDVNQKRYGFRR